MCLQITELEIIDVAENICNMKKEESDWILKLDIVENEGRLEVGRNELMLYVSRKLSHGRSKWWSHFGFK